MLNSSHRPPNRDEVISHLKDSDIKQLVKISEAGVFDLLTGESGPNVDGAFEIMIENLGYTEEEAEKIFQNLEPFFE